MIVSRSRCYANIYRIGVEPQLGLLSIVHSIAPYTGSGFNTFMDRCLCSISFVLFDVLTGQMFIFSLTGLVLALLGYASSLHKHLASVQRSLRSSGPQTLDLDLGSGSLNRLVGQKLQLQQDSSYPEVVEVCILFQLFCLGSLCYSWRPSVLQQYTDRLRDCIITIMVYGNTATLPSSTRIQYSVACMFLVGLFGKTHIQICWYRMVYGEQCL